MPRNFAVDIKKRPRKNILEDSDKESICSKYSDSEYDEENYETSDSEKEETTQKKAKGKKEEKSKTASCSKSGVVNKSRSKFTTKKDVKNDKRDVISNKRKKKNEDVYPYDETDVAIDMSVDFVKPKKIKLSSNLMLERRMLHVTENGKKEYSYPAIVFLRKTKDDKAFEFNIPLTIGQRLIDALEIILNDKDLKKKI
jgi:hypothetical protein